MEVTIAQLWWVVLQFWILTFVEELPTNTEECELGR